MGQRKSKEVSETKNKPIKVKKEAKYKPLISNEDIEKINEYLEDQLEKNGFY